jgi:hypothetical protein
MARATAKATTPPASKTAAPRRPVETAPAPATGRARRDIFEATWTLFCSVRFAVVQILVLAAATTVGTLIPQMPIGLRDFPTDYNAFLTDMQTRFGAFSDAMLWSGMFDLYNSFWFRLLIIIQIYSIIICTLNRWGPIWRQINPTTIRSNEAFLRTMSERATFSGVPLAPPAAAQALRDALRSCPPPAGASRVCSSCPARRSTSATAPPGACAATSSRPSITPAPAASKSSGPRSACCRTITSSRPNASG